MEITYASFPNHSHAKQLAINMTDGALAIPTALGKFALTTSGRLRIVLVSSLTLRYFQIWLNKAMKFLPLCHANPSFVELSFLSKSLFWLRLTASSANCPKTTKMFYYGVVRPPGNEHPLPKSAQLSKYQPRQLRTKKAQNFFFL